MRAFFIIVICLAQISCFQKHPKIDYNVQKDSITLKNFANDTSKVLIADLPVYFDSTDIMVHPIGMEIIEKKQSDHMINLDSYSKREYWNQGFSVNAMQADYITGNMMNLLFENIKSGYQILLTDKVINISMLQYLRALSYKIKKDYIIYTVNDKDLNNDGKLNDLDINSLYISKLDGTDFIKISNPYHEYIGGKLILQEQKYYYRTIEDINKDGSFNKEDKYHYYFIDFTFSPYKNVEYFPLKLIVK